MAYVEDPEGNIVWFGSAMSELQYWKERARKSETRVKELEKKIVRYAEFETPEWKAMVVDIERIYASRSGRSLSKGIKVDP
jgi:hypothetical protein